MTASPTDDVGWVLWAGTIGLESPISARVDGALAGGYTRVTVGPADVAELGTTPDELGRSLRDAGLDVVLDPVMSWYGAAQLAGAGRYAEFGPDEVPASELPQRFADFCDRAAGFGAQVHLEFMPMSAIADLATAWPIVRDADRPNGGILLDTWHFFRSNSDMALLELVPGECILGVQVADAPAEPTMSVVDETFNRMLPGDGELDLTGVLRTLHRTGGLRWVGPEVISPGLAAMAPADAARLAGDRVRDLVVHAQS